MSRSNGTAATPYGYGSMKLIIPDDGPCHPIVGGSYQQQREHQIDVATKIVTGPHGCVSELSKDCWPEPAFPEPAFWRRNNQHEVSSEASAADTQSSAVNSSINSPSPESSEIHGQAPMLIQSLRIFPIGREIISTLWSIDTPAIGNLAIASKGTSGAVAFYISRFHLPSGDFQDCDRLPGALDGMAPERKATIGIGSHLLITGKDKYPSATAIKGVHEIWASAALRDKMWDFTQSHKNQPAMYFKLFPYLMSEHFLLLREGKLEEKFDAYDVPTDERNISYRHLREMGYNIPMLRALSQYGGNLTHMRLHEVPMLDIRLVNLILSICPSLEALSLFECDLLHFNSIIPLLNAVHWASKKMKKTPVLIDFFPRTYFGLKGYGQGTHIISWDGLDVGTLGPSVFTTVLVAVLKALPMGIDLLGQGKLFRKFLDLVPMKPGASTVFCHHLFSYLDSLADRSIPEEVRDALENQVLLSVYQGTEKVFKCRDRDEAFQSFDCCRCGSTMIRGLFDKTQAARPDDQRVCRVCVLDYELEGQEHHRLQKKRGLLDGFLRIKEEVAVENMVSSSDIPTLEEDLAIIKAPIMENRFISGPAPDSAHRHAAWLERFNLPDVADLTDENRDIDVLCVALNAALLDVHTKMSELDGIDLDHPMHRRRAHTRGKYFRQTWESTIWREVTKEREVNGGVKPAGFW
ncbi:hypothetical protein CkaCkLH20_12913 [Colletotrichum karsti]|uniref:Uncharacterized protein n=1 Tax=Colletotrichum karsti TaxID=1095194 RepID=A0A9P6HWK8_9PEZI|nr:uncharacterized protein CkaCkLH20_12913 [Colletotrichum karsti]KAF9869616.1 hypothetical protein CkaCkLH20_12913 [Colletotrichum karsti]